MAKRKKHPKIQPLFVKDQRGKEVEVYLRYDVYESIFDEMNELRKKISAFKKKKSSKKITK